MMLMAGWKILALLLGLIRGRRLLEVAEPSTRIGNNRGCTNAFFYLMERPEMRIRQRLVGAY